MVEDADFTDDFCRFIQSAIPSVETAELLIALAREPEKALSAADAARRLPAGAPVDEARAAATLAALAGRGLAAADGAGWRFAPLNESLRTHTRMLAQAYNERPVTLIRIIYALRDSKIQSFAEAFRLRKP